MKARLPHGFLDMGADPHAFANRNQPTKPLFLSIGGFRAQGQGPARPGAFLRDDVDNAPAEPVVYV